MFELKSYSRKELAMLYFPEGSLQAARANFTNWLLAEKGGKELYEKLRHKKMFSKRIVELVVSILGEP